MAPPTDPHGTSLSEEYDRLLGIFENAPIPMAIADRSGKFLQINKRCVGFLGYSPEEIRTKSFSDITYPEDFAESQARVAELARGDINQYSLEKRYIHKNGDVIWCHLTVTALRNAHGTVDRLVGVMEDVSRWKSIEDALQKSEIFNRTIIENSRDWISILDLNGDLVWMSEEGKKLITNLYGTIEFSKQWTTLWEPEDQGDAQAVFLSSKQGTPSGFVGKLCINGELTSWDVGVSPIRSVSGEVERLLVISRDATDRVRNEEELKEAQKILSLQRVRLESIIEFSEDAIITKNLEGVIQSWNPSAERIFGYKSSEAIGKSIYLIIPLELRDEERSILAKISKGERVEHLETERVAKNGERLFISVTSSPIKDSQGKIMGATKIARDITEKRRYQSTLEQSGARYRALADERSKLLEMESKARRQVEEANRTKDQFLATLSHELRTPLNAILGWAQLAGRMMADPERVREGLGIIERNARSQAQIIEDLLDMNRIMSGTLRLESRDVALQNVVDEAIETVLPGAIVKSITVEKNYEGSPAVVLADPNRLKQIVWNLLTNAVKFTGKGGSIVVTIQRHVSKVQLIVEDSGEGITPEFLPFIFERFSQADISSSRRYGGLGLGLSIVRHLVELHGGEITASSDGVGAGAVFTVTLPLLMTKHSENKRETQPFEAHQDIKNSFRGLRTLVVDDEPDARALIKVLLEERGADVAVAASAAEALTILSERDFDLIVSDISMPYEDGYQFIRKVRKLPSEKRQKIPAIALTAFARSEDRILALEAGFQMHVPKPVEASELVAVISSMTRIG